MSKKLLLFFLSYLSVNLFAVSEVKMDFSVSNSALSNRMEKSGMSNQTLLSGLSNLSNAEEMSKLSNAVRPEYIDEVKSVAANPKDNIVFDSYDEVSIRNHPKEGITEISFVGNVFIHFETHSLKARRVIVTSASNHVLEISAYEDVEFHYNKDIYLASSLHFDPNTRRGVMTDVRSYLKDAGGASPLSSSTGWYYHAKKVTIMNENFAVIEHVDFTSSDKRYPHYMISAEKIFYHKNGITFAYNNLYRVGEGDFMYLPYYFRLNQGSKIKTAFGQEKRIGYYIMNNMKFTSAKSTSDLWFDFYERLGNYGYLRTVLPKGWGPFSSLTAQLDAADDIRVFHDVAADRYVQLYQMDGSKNYQALRQLSWMYKLDAVIKNQAYTLTGHWEDLNDPFFMTKYRSRKQKFDFKQLIQPDQNIFYSHSDVYPSVSSLSRYFNLTAGKFSMSGRWIYQRKVNEEVTNIFMNGRYEYYIRDVKFPERISFTLGSAKLFEPISYQIPTGIRVTISNTNLVWPVGTDVDAVMKEQWKQSLALQQSNLILSDTNEIEKMESASNAFSNDFVEMESTNSIFSNDLVEKQEILLPNWTLLSNLMPNTNALTQLTAEFQSNRNQSINLYTSLSNVLGTNRALWKPVWSASNRLFVEQSEETTNQDTNRKPIAPKYRVSTNVYTLYALSGVSALPGFNYSGFETLDTNGDAVSDGYQHTESGNVGLSLQLLNRILVAGTTLSFNNIKKWSSFEVNRLNNKNQSGYTVNLGASGAFVPNVIFYEKKPWEVRFSFAFHHTLNYQILRTTYATTPLYLTHTTTMSAGWNILKNQVNMSINATHFINYRLTNGMYDQYLDNRISRTLKLGANAKFYWLSASTGVKYDINITTNTNRRTIDWTWDGLTNRIEGGHPQLSLKFTLPHDIPAIGIKNIPNLNLSYTYDLLDQTNLIFNLSSSYSLKSFTLPFVKKVDVLAFSTSYHHDFLNLRNNRFRLSFNTTLWFNKYWKLSFQTATVNNKIYRYFSDFMMDPANQISVTDIYTEFWGNLADSINIFDYDALRRGLFKVQSLSFDLVHYLDEWEMHAIFNVNRRKDVALRIAYWEPEIRVEFKLAGSSDQLPPYSKKFVPVQYQ